MKNVYFEIAHIFWKSFKLWPDHIIHIYHSGRGVTKTSRDAALGICKALHFPHCDVLVLVWELNSCRDKIFADMLSMFERLGIDKKRYHVNSTERHLYIKIKITDKNGHISYNMINFKHLKDGFDAKKGTRPSPGNGWGHIIIFEPTNFYRWEFSHLEELFSTFFRDALYLDKENRLCSKDHPDARTPLEVDIEYNTPKRGSHGSWVNKLTEYAKSNKDSHYHYQFNDYEDLWNAKDVEEGRAPYDEQMRFLGPLNMQRIENTRKYNYKDWLETYKGKIDVDSAACYKNLKQEHLGKHVIPKDRISEIRVSIDVGRWDATGIAATLIWYDQASGLLRIQEGYKYWYHSTSKSIFEQWEWNTETVEEATKPFNKLHPLDSCVMIKQFVDSLHQEFPDNQIIFNMEYSGEGAAWQDILFGVDKDGYSILTGRYGAWDPPWLTQHRTFDKDKIDARIDVQDYLFCYPNCWKTHVPRIWNAYNSAYMNDDGTRNEDKDNKNIDIDTLNTVEYKFDKVDWLFYYDIILKQLEILNNSTTTQNEIASI